MPMKTPALYQAWDASISGSGRVDFPKTNGKAKMSQAIMGIIVPQTQNIETRNMGWSRSHS